MEAPSSTEACMIRWAGNQRGLFFSVHSSTVVSRLLQYFVWGSIRFHAESLAGTNGALRIRVPMQ